MLVEFLARNKGSDRSQESASRMFQKLGSKITVAVWKEAMLEQHGEITGEREITFAEWKKELSGCLKS